jgi:hypothetical protein
MSAVLNHCPDCRGSFDACQHGDKIDRASRALMHVEDEQAAAEARKKSGLPVLVQEGGETYDRAGKREGVSGTYVRRLAEIQRQDPSLFMQVVREKSIGLNEAWMKVRVHGSNADPDTARTPEHIVAPARKEAGGQIGLDPATIALNPIGALESYSLQRSEDGLKLSWTHDRDGRLILAIWINPPYSDIMPWLERAVETVRANPAVRIWILIPASTDAEYGRYALAHASAVCFLNKRVRHLRADGELMGSPEFGSMIVGFGGVTLKHYHELGFVVPGGDLARIVMRLVERFGYAEALRRITDALGSEVAE